MRLSLLTACLLISSAIHAHPQTANTATRPIALAPAMSAPTRVVDAFHSALGRGDAAAAAALLADDAVIYEEGAAERTKAEYASHHLPADAEFSKTVRSEVTRRAGFSEGNLAWVATEGRMKGDFKGKDLDRVTTETVVLRHGLGGWKIVHIHWSSGAKP
jgi:ketosteroid isomerase-like protein